MKVRIDDIRGTWRALLEPLPGTKTYGRTNFYFHNSEKGHTDGCIEVSGELYNVLVEIRNSGQKYIDVKVDIQQINPRHMGTQIRSRIKIFVVVPVFLLAA